MIHLGHVSNYRRLSPLCRWHLSPLCQWYLWLMMGEAVNMLAPDPSAPSQPLASVDRGGFDVAVTGSHVAVRHEASVRDKVDEILF